MSEPKGRSRLHSLAERVRKGERIPGPLAALLTCATPVTRMGMWLRFRKPSVKVAARVISFGNITAGGTGKTPAVIERARAEIALGHRVAVLTRGYGAKQSARAPIVFRSDSDEVPPRRLAEMLGDEPALITQQVPGVLVVKCPDRVLGAQVAIEEHGCDVLLLDDGYQYVRLERDENVLMVDATNPFGNGRLIPRGILREPLAAIARATSAILTRCDLTHEAALERIEATLRAYAPDLSVRRTCHAPECIVRVSCGCLSPLETLKGREIAAVAGIANPEAFYATLELLGARIVQHISVPDHGHFARGTIPEGRFVVTTEKDAMRMPEAGENVHALRIGLQDWSQQGS
jgi:tetraacyldisaccharide 4'-kinase